MPLIRNTVVYVAVGFLPVAANLLLAPVYTSYLEPDEYALIGLATLFQTFLTFFLSFSLDSAFSRIYFDYEKKGRSKYHVLGSLMIAVSIISLIAFGVLWFSGNALFSLLFTNSEFTFTGYGSWVLVTTFSNIIYLFFAVYYRNEEKPSYFILLSILFFIIPVAGTLAGLIWLKEGAHGAITGRAIGSIVFVVALLTGFLIKQRPEFRLSYLKTALKFSLPLVPFQIMFAAFSNVDRFVLERYFTAFDFGVYNFAVMVTGVIPVFLNAVGNATNPRIFRILGGGGTTLQVKRINNMTLLLSTAVICMCVAGVVPAMKLIINPSYSDSYVYIGTLFISFLPYLHYLVYNIPLFYFGKTKVFPLIAFFALVAGITANIFLVPHIGLWSVCVSLYIIRGVQALTAYFFVRRNHYHKEDYIRQKGPWLTTGIIILTYNALLAGNITYDLVPVEILNLLPLALLIICAPLFYTSEISSILSGLRKLRHSAA